MARPVRLQNTTPYSLKEMSNTELDYTASIILTEFADDSTSGGTVILNPATVGDLTLIGEFTDTKSIYPIGNTIPSYTPTFAGTYTNYTQISYSGAYSGYYSGSYLGYYSSAYAGSYTGYIVTYYGGKPINTPSYYTGYYVSSYAGYYTGAYTGYYTGYYSTMFATNYIGYYAGATSYLGDHVEVHATHSMYQNLVSSNTNPTRPLEFDTDGLYEQTDAELEAYILDLSANRLANNGCGSYRLQPGSPTANGLAGTWAQVGTLTDYSLSGTNTTYLWRRTDDTSPTEFRPLKERLNGNQYDVIEMDDNDLATLTNNFRNYIITSGKGKYALQANAPGTGTWVKMGETFFDTRQDVSSNTIAASNVAVSNVSLWIRTA